MVATKYSNPEWPHRIRHLIEHLNLTPAGLAARIGVSPATVSRWIQGKIQPTAEGYVALGNLAPRANAAFFWQRAGIEVGNLPESEVTRAMSSLQVSPDDLQAAGERRISAVVNGANGCVAIPVFRVSAHADESPPHETVSLADAEVEHVLLAPLAWCGSAEHIIGMHVHGDSMAPTIAPESLIIVDTAQTDRDELNGKIVLASHRDLGFKVARLQRLSNTDLLIPANRRCLPLDVSHATRWKMFGRVLWWVSRNDRRED